MDNHLAVCLLLVSRANGFLDVFLTEINPEILHHAVSQSIRWECTLAGRKARHQSLTLCRLLRGRRLQSSVSCFYFSDSLQVIQIVVRVVGFEELGNSDEFETATLEWRLLNIGWLLCSLMFFFLGLTKKYSLLGVIAKEETSTSQIVYGAKPSVRQQIRGREDDDFEFDLEWNRVLGVEALLSTSHPLVTVYNRINACLYA